MTVTDLHKVTDSDSNHSYFVYVFFNVHEDMVNNYYRQLVCSVIMEQI